MTRAIVERPASFDEAEALVLDTGKCDRCDGTAYVVMDNSSWQWTLSCVYCNLRARYTPPVSSKPASVSGSGHGRHEFRNGRFTGAKIVDIATTREGKEYLEWYAKEGKSSFMKERVREFLGIA